MRGKEKKKKGPKDFIAKTGAYVAGKSRLEKGGREHYGERKNNHVPEMKGKKNMTLALQSKSPTASAPGVSKGSTKGGEGQVSPASSQRGKKKNRRKIKTEGWWERSELHERAKNRRKVDWFGWRRRKVRPNDKLVCLGR